jgi:hypothetical protein
VTHQQLKHLEAMRGALERALNVQGSSAIGKKQTALADCTEAATP